MIDGEYEVTRLRVNETLDGAVPTEFGTVAEQILPAHALKAN
ncbi:MAG: hypothetical protein AAFY72_03630 [Cyanobacteria bacterium J06649_4]